jgi:hypothetical protein
LRIDDTTVANQRDEFQKWFEVIEQKVSVCSLSDQRKKLYVNIAKERLERLLS